MSVIGTRLSPVLEQNIRDHCRGLGGLFKGIGSLFDLVSKKTARSGGGN